MSDKFEQGLKVRKSVMGDDFVEKALNRSTAFAKPLQVMVTEQAWGDVWGRPGLAVRDRSLINLAMIAVLNRPNEFKGHVRGALRNGVTVEEIREVLLQVSAYAGFPAAIDSFRLAAEVLEAEGIDLNSLSSE